MKVSMKNHAGLTRTIPFGLSIRALIFGPFVFLFRGQIKKAILWTIFMCITGGLSNIALMFLINKISAHYYLENGYSPTGDGWDKAGPVWDVAVPTA